MLIGKLQRLFADEPDRATDEQADKRLNRRHTVLMQASIYPIDTFSDVIVHNASRTGLMGETDVELLLGQTVHMSLDEISYQSGLVRWTRGRRFGLDLDDALTMLGRKGEVEHGLGDGQRHRARRYNFNIGARLSTGRPPRPATVRNVSRTGLLLETSPGLLTGQHVLVRLSNRPLIAGRVQWANQGRIGVKALAPIAALQLVYSDED